ncbi:Hypothetical protein, putative [Bodo saltans]|uniref:Zeta toxin domain-containing protein n=1 Tax=Bodo saltans TaxID=75058 RepID=A0A0S4JKV3_BODSA|nr:Hypothetical protein, putative [Bodo saltans]|eukprot:CUG90023.1 Hypothetical protein, putative [Bodo saltans]
MHWRCGVMRAMCLGSTLGIDSVLQHPRGRAAQRPTMSPALLRGMRTIATRPEWKTTDHRTQGPPSSPPLRAWHGVVDEHLHPSVGLMSRSRTLRAVGTVPPTLAEMTPAERSVVDEIKQCGTVYNALLSSASRLYAAKSRELNDDINSFATSVAEGGTSDLQLTVEMMGPSLSLSRYCVAFFTFADRNLIVGVAALGDDPLIPKGIKMLETIQLQNDDIKSTTYRIYSATAGLDTMSKHKGAQSASPYNELVQFVVSRLQLFVDRDPERYSPHELLKTAHFKGWRVAVQGEGSVEPIRIAGTEDDLRWLEERHVDATGGTTIDSKGFDRREPLAAYYKQQKMKKEKNDPEVGMILFDLATSATWDNDPNVVILIGGESGSGKTWRMITNHSGESHLVVYIRLNSEENANSHNTDYKTIIAQDEILHPKGPRTIDEDVIKAARRARRKAFKAFVLPKVKAAINEVCPALWKKLCGEEKKAFPLFEVRLCFDEMGGNPALIRACCAVGNINLRRGFKWMPWVRIRMFAAGTGVGTVENPGGSENSFYLLATLQRDVYDSADSSSEPSVYWTLRREKLKENVYVKEIADKVDAIADKWGNEPLRRELMAERDTLLKRAMRSVPQRALNPGKRADSLRVVYMREALFSAVEGDRIGRFVLCS